MSVRTIIWGIWWGLVLVGSMLFFSDHPLHSDEGAILNIAWQLWNGEVLYRTVNEFLAPGPGYFIYAVWQLIGEPSYLSAKVVAVLMWFGSAVGLVLVIRQFTSHWFAKVFGVLLWMYVASLYPLINHNSMSSFVAVWWLVAVVYFVRSIKEHHLRRWWWPLLLGMASGAVLLFLQTKGVVLIGGMGLVFWVDRSKAYSQKEVMQWFLLGIGGVILVLAPALLYWGIGTLLQHWFILPFTADYVGYTPADSKMILCELLVLVLMGVMSVVTKNRQYLLLFVMQLLLYGSSINYIDLPHLAINSFPLVIFLAVVFVTVFEQYHFSKRLQMVLYALLLLPVLLLLLFAGPTQFYEDSLFSVDLAGKTHGGIFDWPEVQAAEYIYAGPFLPGFYFELRKPNPFTATNNVAICDDACQQEMLDTMQRVQPEYAFLNYAMVQKFGYTADMLIDLYIQDEYTYCMNTGYLLIYARDTCPALIR